MRTVVRESYEPAGARSSVVSAVVELARTLRAAGVPVSTSETIDGVVALDLVDLTRRDHVRAALRAALVKDGDHDEAFGRLFDLAFPPPAVPAAQPRREPAAGPGSALPDDAADLRDLLAEALRAGDEPQVRLATAGAVDRWAGVGSAPAGERHHVQRVLRQLDLGRVLQRLLRGDPERSDLQRKLDAAAAGEQVEQVRRLIERLVAQRVRAAGGGERPAGPDDLVDRPILRVGPDELAALRAEVRPLARRLAARLGRRRRRGRATLDMRRTMRASLSTGGVPLAPVLRRRSPSRPDLVVLCDVSGSVARFAPFMLALLHALHGEFGRVRSWAFVDGVVEITDLLEAAPGVLDVHHLLSRRGLLAGDGRSDYGRAFRTFLDIWGDAVAPRTTVLVVGDARGHDRRPALAETAELRRRARRLYWLNPEPAGEWDTGDSRMAAYAAHCTGSWEVCTLRQLGDCVAGIS
ncbi:MAG: VWA domain-containing protein [Mycobacteriales bacterium]